MKHPPDDTPAPESAPIDETLRLIAHAPVPEGLEDRVHAAVFQAAPRPGRILPWPVPAEPPAFWAGNNWVRTAAAAAIVFVVAGGGWGIYRRVEHPVARVILLPAAQPAVSGGFSSAGAIRTPQTVNGPVVQPTGLAAKKIRKKHSARAVASRPAVAGQAAPAPPASVTGK